MKENLLVKLNDIIVDVSGGYDKSIKKSLEFFLGCMVQDAEIEEFRKRKCPATNHECILLFLNEKNIFLRDKALIKKFTEYYVGKEFSGFIKDSILLIDKKTLEKLPNKYAVILVSLMPLEETDFLVKKFGLESYPHICADSPNDAIRKAKETVKGNIIYLGDTLIDYNASVEENISFIGMNMDKSKITKGKVIEKIEEL